MKIEKKNINLIVYDFDGVMTDNKVLVMENGMESVVCNRADGLGVDMIREMGIKQIILSTESNIVVNVRAKKLNLQVIQNCKNKKNALTTFCNDNRYSLDSVLYVGNDVNDEEAMKIVKYPVCPNDANEVIKELSCYITKAAGGCGVVRELADILS
jgi:3-deoxy-D-manno-octulosonate 8-phosphate phosphatase (KDO 8-P phosphatase)